jgi:integrase
MTGRHEILGGKVQVFRRPLSPYWQCEATIGGNQFRKSTKRESLAEAKDVAEDWFLTLKGKDRWGGGLAKGKTFRKAAEKFLDEFGVLTNGERSPRYVESLRQKINKHPNPFFGDKPVAEINESLIQDYRVHRAKAVDKDGKAAPPARTTIHIEMITLGHVLKTAKRHGWLEHLPDLSAPYKASGKIAHRAWFSPEEYKTLYQATRRRSKNPLDHRKWRWECEQLHDYVLFMANTGLRPDECARLEFRDVTIVGEVVVVDGVTIDNRILEIEVRGKRGVGYCKSMPGAVRPFERARDRERLVAIDATATPVVWKGTSRGGNATDETKKVKPRRTDLIFGPTQRELINEVLGELDLKFDRDGQRRTAYSLRHTYICFRLMEGADIYQIAKNCRTSVEMIEKYYAAHIKNMLDAEAINVRRMKPGSTQGTGELTEEEE